ncbi:MAG: hypothetical protein ACXVIJ_15645, partial [Thermoanaerobaculia bacterium]
SGCWSRIDEFETMWTRDASNLRIEIHGLPPGQYDFLVVSANGRNPATFIAPGPEVAIDAP